jgi:hypothetical protein
MALNSKPQKLQNLLNNFIKKKTTDEAKTKQNRRSSESKNVSHKKQRTDHNNSAAPTVNKKKEFPDMKPTRNLYVSNFGKQTTSKYEHHDFQVPLHTLRVLFVQLPVF